jgi:hypothetical protein
MEPVRASPRLIYLSKALFLGLEGIQIWSKNDNIAISVRKLFDDNDDI